MKRSVASFVLQRTCIYSKKRNGPICHDGMRVVFSCSAQEQILYNSQYNGASRGNFTVKLQRVIPTAVQPTSKVVGVAGPLTLHGGDTGLGLAATQ